MWKFESINLVLCTVSAVLFVVCIGLVVLAKMDQDSDERSLGSTNDQLNSLPGRFVSMDRLEQRSEELSKSVYNIDSKFAGFVPQTSLTRMMSGLTREIQKVKAAQQQYEAQMEAQQEANKRVDQVQSSVNLTHLTHVLGVVNSTALAALHKAGSAFAAVSGIAFVKNKLHGCPPGSVECTLWHWYSPDPFDPYCGGSAAVGVVETEDSADGSCKADLFGRSNIQMLGCCRHE